MFVTHGEEDTVTELFYVRLRDEMKIMMHMRRSILAKHQNLSGWRRISLYEAEVLRLQLVALQSIYTKVYWKSCLVFSDTDQVVIRKNEGCENKDLEKLSRDVQSLWINGTETDG